MKYSDLILKDYPVAVWTLDDDLTSATENVACSSFLDTSGSGEHSGEYVYNSGMKVINTGIPLVLGGGNSSIILDNGSNPSLTIPRLNTLSGDTIGESWSLEFWIKIHQSDSSGKFKVLDAGSDESFGLYIYKNYIYLNIDNDYFIAAPVSSWNMQHHVVITCYKSNFNLIVDGIRHEKANRNVPSSYTHSSSSTNFNFYGNDELGTTTIDAIALYPYILTEVNSKRHIVYGLGYDYAGEIFDNLSGSYTKFSGNTSNKVLELIVPSENVQAKPIYENVIYGRYGYQLDNSDLIEYINPSPSATRFEFNSSNILKIRKASKYFAETFGIGFSFTPTTLDTSNEFVLFSTYKTLKNKITVVLDNANILVRMYKDSLSHLTVNYVETNIGSVTEDSSNLFGMSYDQLNKRYVIHLNGNRTYITNVDKTIFSNDSTITFGGEIVDDVAGTVDNVFSISNGYFSRITLFKSYIKYNSTMGAANSTTIFNTFYEDFTITYNQYIRMHKKGTLNVIMPIEQFALDAYSSSLNKKFIGAITVENGYPKVVNPEAEVTINHYGETSLIASQTMSLEKENVLSINSTTNIADNMFIVSTVFDSQDCLYTPPIIGQFKIMSFGKMITSGSSVQYIASDNLKNVQIVASDNKMTIQDETISAIYLGDHSGVKFFGNGGYIDYSVSSLDNDEDRGVKSMSMLIKRNSTDTSKKIIGWTPVASTTPPSSADIYINGVLDSTSSVSSGIDWLDIDIPLDTWTHIAIVLDNPLIVKAAQSPRIYFGDSTGGSNVSIQYLGIVEEELSPNQILAISNSYSGENIISITEDDIPQIIEGNVQVYADNWITVA